MAVTDRQKWRSWTLNRDLICAGSTTLSGAVKGSVEAVKSAAYQVVVSDFIIPVNTDAARTITLPTAVAAGAGALYVIKDSAGTGAATNAITIATPGSETVDGSATGSITTDRGAALIYCDGSNYFTI